MSGAPGRFQLLATGTANDVRASAAEERVIHLGAQEERETSGPSVARTADRVAARSGGDLLRTLHERARAAALSPDDLAVYAGELDRFLRGVVAEQNGRIRKGQTPRRLARVARCLQVELTWGAETHRALTFDLGAGGFCAVLPSPPPLDGIVLAKLCLSRCKQVSASVRVAGLRTRRGSARVSFAFEGMADAERQQLEAYVADELLERFRYRSGSPPVGPPEHDSAGTRASPGHGFAAPGR